MKRMMSWTPTPSHLMKQMPRKRGPRHKGLESTKWNDEISYLGSEKLMSFWAIFLVLHFASLICGNPLFGCYKGGEHPNIYIYMCVFLALLASPIPRSVKSLRGSVKSAPRPRSHQQQRQALVDPMPRAPSDWRLRAETVSMPQKTLRFSCT